jgi:transposase InsO family protein
MSREHEKPSFLDKRPYMEGSINGVRANFLIDTGACVSVISEELFRKIPNHWNLAAVPVEPGFRLSSASGDSLQLGGSFMFTLSMKGRTVTRPLYVVKGLSKCQAILGVDFIKEQQMILTPEDSFFRPLSKSEDHSLATLSPAYDTILQPRSVLRTSLQVKSARGEQFISGISGVASAGADDVGVWDTLSTTNSIGQVVTVVTNPTDQPVFLKRSQVIGFFHPLSREDLEKGKSEEEIDAIFSDFTKEPKEPIRGPCATEMSEEEMNFMAKNLNIKAPLEYYQKYVDLCVKYHDVFSKSKFDLGHSDVVQHKINMKCEDPIHVRQFRIPLEHRQTIYDWVDELLAKGAIEVSRSCFNTPIFLVPKPHGHGMRAVLDFRQVNDASVPDRYTIREVRDCVDEIGMAGSDVFSTVDLTSGFWQQSLAPESRQYTAFTVPGKGTRYQWTVTPMGLQGSPASFARLIDYIMRGIDEVLTYIDDILPHTKGHPRHLEVVEEVFLRLRKYNLKLNISKSIFGADEVIYLGYKINKHGLSPGSEKLGAVSNFPPPDSVKKIREFVGLANYFRFLIPHFAHYAGIMTNLTKKNSSYNGGVLPEHASAAFNYLKTRLLQEPVVSHPRPDLEYHLSTDAAAGDDLSPGGFGAVLTQVDTNGQERVIAYASRSLRENEKNYSAYLLELAAAAWAIDHFSVYLQGRHFKLFTDHKPLETLAKVHKKTLNRLQEQMLEYDFQICYKKGVDNSVADALSRNVALSDEKTNAFINTMNDDSGTILEAQNNDAFIRDVRHYVQTGSLPNHTLAYRSKVERVGKDSFLSHGLIWLNLKRPGRRTHPVLLCPRSLVDIVLNAAHCSFMGGHSGKQRTIDRVELGYWWPGLTYDIDQFLSRCQRCKEIQGKKPDPSPLQSLPICEEPNFRVHMDLYGPLQTRSISGAKYVMVITDAFSKYTELAAIKDKSAETVARAFFEKWICRHGVPRTIISDRGKEFLNNVMKDLCDFMGIDHSATSAYHPQSNSQAETYNKTMARYLSAMLENHQTLDWEELLPAMMFAYNCHVQRATQESPFFLTYLHSPRLPYFNLQEPRKLYRQDYLGRAFSDMRLSFKMVRDNLKDAREAREQYFNRRTKERSFSVGQQVLVNFPKCPVGANRKFYKQWKGPYRVVKLLGRLNLRVQPVTGSSIVVHVDRVRHLTIKDEEQYFDSNPDSLFLRDPNLFPEEKQEKARKDICEPPHEVIKSSPVIFFNPADDFSNYVESDDESNRAPEINQGRAASPASRPASPRVTRDRARRDNIYVRDFPLPAHCPTSKRAEKCSGK